MPHHRIKMLRCADTQDSHRADAPATPRSTDAADDYLISLAESARAVLVSGDKHVLALAESFPIETPVEFLRRLAAQE